jgi:hypothetical protein
LQADRAPLQPQGSAPGLTIVSGGQTGVDRAALDLALRLGLACGGWIPKGRRTDDGVLPPRYPLRETPHRGYPERTRRNVLEADATLIVTRGAPTGGTALTRTYAHRLGRPYWLADLAGEADPVAVRVWLDGRGVRILNVAGPRESTAPGIYAEAMRFLHAVLATPVCPRSD